MIKAIIYHVPYRIYDNALFITETCEFYYFAEDENDFPFILVYDRQPIIPDDYRNPKAIRNPAIVIPNLMRAMDAIGDEIRDMTTEVDGIKTLVSEMRLMSTAEMYEKVIAEETKTIADMNIRIARLRANVDYYHKWIEYLEKIGKIGDEYYV